MENCFRIFENQEEEDILKIFIRLIHFYYYLSPNKISYKLGSKKIHLNFLFGKSLKSNFSKVKFFKEARKNIVLSGWGSGLGLVLKHKKLIIKNFNKDYSLLK